MTVCIQGDYLPFVRDLILRKKLSSMLVLFCIKFCFVRKKSILKFHAERSSAPFEAVHRIDLPQGLCPW